VGVRGVGLIDALDLARLHRIALALTNDRHAADDLLADAIARTLPHWNAGRIDDADAYVRRVLVNLAAHRWRRRRLSRERDHRGLEWLRRDSDTAAEIAERDRTIRAVAQLPPRRRAIIVLRYYDDLSLDQIAATLGVETGTVKSQLSRALGQLRRSLDGQER